MSALLTDLYQLTMLQSYLDEGMQAPAVFELFVRKLPADRSFLVAAGLEQALDFLEGLAFVPEEIAWLERERRFSRRLLDYLEGLRFEGAVHAMREGTIFFPNEPVLRVTAPLPQAQLVESRILNIVHFQTLVASKAARMALAARGRQLVDFGMRRAHEYDAAVFAARAAYLAGFAGTATVEAGRRFAIPLFGTMAHSFIQAHATEVAAFEAFAHAWPKRPTLLVDTYDTEAAVSKVVGLAPELAREGIEIGGIRLDSGDLAAHARAARGLLDAGGLQRATIFASGDLNERRIAGLLASGAPIDGFGVGTALVTSGDAPSLDAVYKLQSYGGVARRKRSEGKATWPGAKQVWRSYADDGRMRADVIGLESEALGGQPLLQPVMADGRRLAPSPRLDELRAHHARELGALPDELRALDAPACAYSCGISAGLRDLARQVDAATR